MALLKEEKISLVKTNEMKFNGKKTSRNEIIVPNKPTLQAAKIFIGTINQPHCLVLSNKEGVRDAVEGHHGVISTNRGKRNQDP
jgi:hypothetical protein